MPGAAGLKLATALFSSSARTRWPTGRRGHPGRSSRSAPAVGARPGRRIEGDQAPGVVDRQALRAGQTDERRRLMPGSIAIAWVTWPVAGENVSWVPSASSAVQLVVLGQAIATSGEPRSESHGRRAWRSARPLRMSTRSHPHRPRRSWCQWEGRRPAPSAVTAVRVRRRLDSANALRVTVFPSSSTIVHS